MVAVYCQQQFNGGVAVRRYLEQYPNRRQPNRKLFQILFKRLREAGSVKTRLEVGRPVTRIVAEETS